METQKSHPTLVPHLEDTKTIRTPKSRVQISVTPGRPTIKFVDVGGKFIDVEERLRRIAQAERRAKINQSKAQNKRVTLLERRARNRT
jgi:hypothetical protein